MSSSTLLNVFDDDNKLQRLPANCNRSVMRQNIAILLSLFNGRMLNLYVFFLTTNLVQWRFAHALTHLAPPAPLLAP